MDEKMQNCIVNCLNCYQMCSETLAYCLEKGGDHANPEHMLLLIDCAKICQTSADFMLRGSTMHTVTCKACEEICRACAKSCDSFGDDPKMKDCASACYTCADSCKEMAAM